MIHQPYVLISLLLTYYQNYQNILDRLKWKKTLQFHNCSPPRDIDINIYMNTANQPTRKQPNPNKGIYNYRPLAGTSSFIVLKALYDLTLLNLRATKREIDLVITRSNQFTITDWHKCKKKLIKYSYMKTDPTDINKFQITAKGQTYMESQLVKLRKLAKLAITLPEEQLRDLIKQAELLVKPEKKVRKRRKAKWEMSISSLQCSELEKQQELSCSEVAADKQELQEKRSQNKQQEGLKEEQQEKQQKRRNSKKNPQNVNATTQEHKEEKKKAKLVVNKKMIKDQLEQIFLIDKLKSIDGVNFQICQLEVGCFMWTSSTSSTSQNVILDFIVLREDLASFDKDSYQFQCQKAFFCGCSHIITIFQDSLNKGKEDIRPIMAEARAMNIITYFSKNGEETLNLLKNLTLSISNRVQSNGVQNNCLYEGTIEEFNNLFKSRFSRESKLQKLTAKMMKNIGFNKLSVLRIAEKCPTFRHIYQKMQTKQSAEKRVKSMLKLLADCQPNCQAVTNLISIFYKDDYSDCNCN